jgi:hypothetical protein
MIPHTEEEAKQLKLLYVELQYDIALTEKSSAVS